MYDEKQKLVFQRVKATFPETFGLRAYPGEVFRISDTSSYFGGNILSCEENDLMLYTERKKGETWVDFAKATAVELRREIVVDPATPVQVSCSFTMEELRLLHESLATRISALQEDIGHFGTEAGRRTIEEGIAHLTILRKKVFQLAHR